MISTIGSALTLALLPLTTVAQQRLAPPPTHVARADASVGQVSDGPTLRFVDLNGDALPDRLTFAADGTLSVALNNGARWFDTVWQTLPTVVVSALLAEDLDGDHDVDLYLVSPEDNVVLLGDGTGHFVEATEQLGLSDDGLATGVERVDMDGDGIGEILLHNRTGDVVFWANGAGSYERSVQTPPVARSESPEPVAGASADNVTLSQLLEAMALSGMDPATWANRVNVRMGQNALGAPVLDFEGGITEASGTHKSAPAPKGKPVDGEEDDDVDDRPGGQASTGAVNKLGANKALLNEEGSDGHDDIDHENDDHDNDWEVHGNFETDPKFDFLGTRDAVDLVLRTYDKERMRILATGEIEIQNDTSVGGDLDVAGDVDVGGDVDVEGSVDVEGDIDVVGNASIGGDLDVAGIGRFNDITTSTGPSTGAVVIAGGIGVGERLNVASATQLRGDVSITSSTQSTSTSIGALTVTGGTGVGGNINLGGDLDVGGDAVIGGLLELTDLDVSGDAEIGGSMGIGTSAPTNNLLHVRGAGTLNGNHVALFDNTGTSSPDGVAIRVNAGTPGSGNNFLTFLNSAGSSVGRIEGQTLSELHNSFRFIWDTTMAGLDEAFVLAEGVACAAQLDAAEVIVMGLEGAQKAAQWIEQTAYLENTVGVLFASGSGDYAEYLERLNPDDEFEAGDIVGVFGGRISHSTTGAEQVLAISTAPIVLGNMPAEGQEDRFEKVAFLGQIPIKVLGPVQQGDYIIPSGLEDGHGVAVSPDLMTADEFARVVGRAWGASNDPGPKEVNAAIGLNAGDVADLVRQHEASLTSLRSTMSRHDAELRALQAELELLRDVRNPR